MENEKNAVVYADVLTKEQAASLFKEYFDDAPVADALAGIANIHLPFLSASEIIHAFADSYPLDGGGLAVITHKPEDSDYPAVDLLKNNSVASVYQETDAYHAVECVKHNFLFGFDKTFFPLLSVNDVLKTFASLFRIKRGLRIRLSDGTDDGLSYHEKKEQSVFMMKKGIADVPRLPLEEKDKELCDSIAKKLEMLAA